MVFVFSWLTSSLSLTTSVSVHVAASDIVSVSFTTECIPSHISTPHPPYPFISQWTDCCSRVLAIVNSECCDGHWSESIAFFSTFPEKCSQGLKQMKYNHVVQDQRWKGWREGTHMNSLLVNFFHYLRVY